MEQENIILRDALHLNMYINLILIFGILFISHMYIKLESQYSLLYLYNEVNNKLLKDNSYDNDIYNISLDDDEEEDLDDDDDDDDDDDSDNSEEEDDIEPYSHMSSRNCTLM